MNLARAALAYAAHGRPVFPLRRGEKRPVTAHGVKDASTDATQIRAWWRGAPESNIGLAILPDELVVDVDVRNGGDQTLAGWIDEHGPLPTTPCQETPTRGVHYVFNRPAAVELVGKPAKGIDILGRGKYIVGAPSRVKDDTGRWRPDPYRWVTRLSTTPLADLPSWLAKLVTRAPAATVTPLPRIESARVSVIERAEKWLEKADPAISGQHGHATCFRVVSRLVRGFILDEETALALLERIYNPRCDPPWSRRDLKHKITQAAAKGACEWGALLNERRSA